MGWFGKDKDKKDPEVVEAAPSKEALRLLDEQVAAALPQRSSFFDAMRTQPFVNHNIVENYVEFWAALKVDAENDKWRVMHYMVYDLDRADGKFVSEKVTKNDVGFAEAVAQIAKAEYTASKLITHADFDIAKQYPPHLFPEMKVHFYDLEYYKKAANIEGIAFDEYNAPYRRVEGKVFQSATFKRSEIRDSSSYGTCDMMTNSTGVERGDWPNDGGFTGNAMTPGSALNFGRNSSAIFCWGRVRFSQFLRRRIALPSTTVGKPAIAL